MTPLLAMISLVTTLAPFTVRAPSFVTVITSRLPDAVFTSIVLLASVVLLALLYVRPNGLFARGESRRV